MTVQQRDDLIRYLTGFVTEDRVKRLRDVLNQRTRRISVVLEDLYQPHNASAVLRSCDCYGVQHVYTIETFNKLDISRGVTKNAHQWLTLHRFREPETDNTTDCISHLKEKGFTIVATTPHNTDCELPDLPIDQPIAILFGAEKNGLSDSALNQADVRLRIPMYGFSESLNISVSAAICLYDLTRRMKAAVPEEDWNLPDEEKSELMLHWLKKSVRAPEKLIEAFKMR